MKLKNILTVCEDSKKQILEFEGDMENLDDIEEFAIWLYRFPFIKELIESLIFVTGYEQEVGGLLKSIELLENTGSKVKQCEKLNRVINLILRIGNYLNQGTAKGKAFGFKLSCLSSLREFKSKQNGKSLL